MAHEYGPYRVHPVADLLPLAEGPSRDGLIADIRKHGQIDPIVLAPDGETIVDGRNRFLACQDAGVDPIFRKLADHYGDVEVIQFIISVNIVRRQLDQGQTAVLGLQLEPYFTRAAKERQREGGRTKLPSKRTEPEVRDQIAKLLCVGQGTMARAKYVKHNKPSLIQKVISGELKLDSAYRAARAMRKPEEKVSRTTVGHMVLHTHEGTAVDYRQPKGKATFNTTNDQVSWAPWT